MTIFKWNMVIGTDKLKPDDCGNVKMGWNKKHRELLLHEELQEIILKDFLCH